MTPNFEIAPKVKFFALNTHFYTTQYPDLFITYKGFNMHNGERNPLQLPEDDQYDRLSTQVISGNLNHT